MSASTDATPGTVAFDEHHFDHAPWDFRHQADDAQRAAQRAAQERLCAQRPGTVLGDDVYLSPLAAIQTDTLEIGDRSYVAARAHLTGDVVIGADSTVNISTVVRGTVRIGTGVRIGGQTSILGFNHSFAPGRPVYQQPLTHRGITVADDVWIGSHVVVLDGVTIGEGAVIGAGAVVTKDIPAGAIAVGNPARVKGWRDPARRPAQPLDLEARLTALGATLPADLSALLDSCLDPQTRLYADTPGAAPHLRAQCDAVELAALAGQDAPAAWSRDEAVALLRAHQDPVTGLIRRLRGPDAATAAAPPTDAEEPCDPRDGELDYHLLCVGYALDLLGSHLEHPVRPLQELTAADVVAELGALDWERDAWRSGARVDTLGTALRWNLARGHAAQPGMPEALLGWLAVHQDPRTGLWGSEAPSTGLMLPVNGFYRATRGTFAQLDVPLPHPEATIDTVLRHAGDERFFARHRQNACNVLDVAHPLWLARRQTAHRADEIRELAARLLDDALHHYDGGFGFQAPARDGLRDGAAEIGLQGTEMWLAILWILADLLGISGALGYRPRGVHSPDPVPYLRQCNVNRSNGAIP